MKYCRSQKQLTAVFRLDKKTTRKQICEIDSPFSVDPFNVNGGMHHILMFLVMIWFALCCQASLNKTGSLQGIFPQAQTKLEQRVVKNF